MATSSSLLSLSSFPTTSPLSAPRLLKPFRIKCVSSSLDCSKKSAVVEKSSTQFKAVTDYSANYKTAGRILEKKFLPVSLSGSHVGGHWKGEGISSTILNVGEDQNGYELSGTWQWRFEDNPINVYYEEHEGEGAVDTKSILMIPTISDVSTVEEWRVVAKDIVKRNGGLNWRATIVDWPGLGYSDRPALDYNADIMEDFLIQFMNARNSPLSSSGSDLVIFGGGHAATIAIRAAGKGLIKPSAIAAVAPTWAGPLPIVFGRGSDMESRYGLLRGTLRAPAVGWVMYNMLVSNEKAIQSQYKSHVYANPENVTRNVIESRYALTKRKGARYVPAAFLTGLLDPVQSREEFLALFAELDGKIPIMVVSSSSSPKRSKAEMEALKGAKGVVKFVEVPGALLPQEEYPLEVAAELYEFLQDNFECKN